MEIEIKKEKFRKKVIYVSLIIVFSVVESFLVLSYPQFGNSIGAYEFKYVQWEQRERQYCYVYKDVRYRRIRIWSNKKKNSDFYRVIMPDNEEVLVCQSDRRLIIPSRGGMTDFDHYKAVLEKDNYNILKRVIENKYSNPLPQNILFMIFITILNAGFSALIVFPEQVRGYYKLICSREMKGKEKYIQTRLYRIIGTLFLIIIFYACIRK